jgi:hypothetical protein
MTRPTRSERIESGLLVLILAVVAGAAGWASFTHVHDWTMRHVPPGTPSAFGWVNAVISELVPIAALLTIRRRRRAGSPTTYPILLLLAAASLSLAAQLAVATPSPSGWLLSAVPALAFMALVKLVFTGTAAPTVTPPAPSMPPSAPTPASVPSTRPAAVVPVPAGAFTRPDSPAEVAHQ